ncbi:MAG: glycine cleavage system protein GcvH [Candidatus Neomarinimicrobiota bacterium]|jgi:glycine cleavage system H protein|nr:glycine cleavage system protein GcvH [Candidatus Neomarinimicrobiota bacterium]
MNVPNDLLYTSDHEWVSVEGNVATVGITDFAQSELGDIVFVEFPELNSTVEKGQSTGSIEAVKTVADLYMPISGTVIAVNENLDKNPEAVNDTPYDDGWMVKIEITNQDEISDLLTAPAYNDLIS